MILVMGHIKLGAGEGARLRDTLVEHATTTAAEDGCEFYNFAFDCARPRHRTHLRTLGKR